MNINKTSGPFGVEREEKEVSNKSNTSMRAKLVTVRVRDGKEGLFYATSPQLKGLLIAEPTLDALELAIPTAIAELYEACGMSVVVTKMEDAEDGHTRDGTPWVAFPAAVARAALDCA